jgi:hypothetical protein
MNITPGFANNTSVQTLGSVEQKISSNLAKVWRITFAKSVEFKNVQYKILFCKPTDELRRQFNLEFEVLCVFTPPNFDSRLFDFVDRQMDIYSNRLDKLSIILISPDSDITERVNRFLQSNPESRIVAPFTYDELNTTALEGNFIENRLRSSFYGRNLFDFNSPLRSETYFFGREKIVQELYDKYKSGESSGLFGLRKTGKTSLLFALVRRLRANENPVVFIEGELPEFHKRRWNEVLYYIIRKISEEYSIPHEVLNHSESDYTEKDASGCFATDLKRISLHLDQGPILVLVLVALLLSLA